MLEPASKFKSIMISASVITLGYLVAGVKVTPQEAVEQASKLYDETALLLGEKEQSANHG